MTFKQPDDTFFVEDDSYHRRNNHNYIRYSNLPRAEALANELSSQARETYMDDIVKHMNQMEALTLPDVASMDIQHEIQWFMRPYLIDFLVEAHSAFQLLPETLFLAVNLLDRYCSRRVVYKRHYQLVGCAALLIAAKYGDRKDRVPLIRELKSMCCNLYDEDMFTQMEWHVLNTLDWLIGYPTVDCFIKLATQSECKENAALLEHMTWYLCEIASYHKEFVSKRPSVMATVSIALARAILGQPEALDIPDHETRQIILELSQKLHRPSQVLSRKYSSSHYSRVSTIVDLFLQEQEAINCRATKLSNQSKDCQTDSQCQRSEQFPGTPQKQPDGSLMVHGYMTPPITPDVGNFVNGEECHHYDTSKQCPITPTPSNFPHALDQYNQQSSSSMQ
ncbi:G1/S-specific cyclin CLN1 [Golovinomyces cichoracearum]|uniref:G1/S-specific cyclin CLN1 n=1 Tax=Golovinomyces cichoracearum TaxID=62708 RepID=A0A420ICW8_9PEZI|nr:G1/S-specific cyclin CLN1 [Golovinomyces cichoracearum]